MDSVIVFHAIPLTECLRSIVIDYAMTNIWDTPFREHVFLEDIRFPKDLWDATRHDPQSYYFFHPRFSQPLTNDLFTHSMCKPLHAELWICIRYKHDTHTWRVQENQIPEITHYLIKHELFCPRLDIDTRHFFMKRVGE